MKKKNEQKDAADDSILNLLVEEINTYKESVVSNGYVDHTAFEHIANLVKHARTLAIAEGMRVEVSRRLFGNTVIEDALNDATAAMKE